MTKWPCRHQLVVFVFHSSELVLFWCQQQKVAGRMRQSSSESGRHRLIHLKKLLLVLPTLKLRLAPGAEQQTLVGSSRGMRTRPLKVCVG